MSRVRSLTVMILSVYCWVLFCMHERQRDRRGEVNPLIHYPLQCVCISQLVDNIRLLLGAAFGRTGVSLLLSRLWYFSNMLGIALMLAALATMLGLQLGIPMLQYVGGVAAVFYAINAVGAYGPTVHSSLVYTESEDLPRYINKRSREIKDEPQIMVLPPLLGVIGAVAVTFIVMATVGDSLPFTLQILSVIGQTSVPMYKEQQRMLSNCIHMVSLVSIMRVQRYLV